jgi:hypothetical protein
MAVVGIDVDMCWWMKRILTYTLIIENNKEYFDKQRK